MRQAARRSQSVVSDRTLTNYQADPDPTTDSVANRASGDASRCLLKTPGGRPAQACNVTWDELRGYERCPGAGSASPCGAARSEAESVTSCARLRIPLNWSG